MKRHLLVLAALGSSLAVVCSRPSARPAAKDTLFRHLENDPATLDPIVTTEEFGLRIEEMIFRPLVGIDRDRRFVPGLATSWAVSSDGLVYDFRLDPTAKWEDGAPITSADVAFTIDRIRNPKNGAANWSWGFEHTTAVETPDAATVIVRFDRPYAERLLAFNVPVLSAAAYAHPETVGRKPVGSGPYRLDSWTTKQSITLVRRPEAAGSALFGRVVFRILPDAAVRFRVGTRGELDEFKIDRDQQSTAARSPEFAAHNALWKVPYPVVALIVWNCRNPLLADPRVRRALARAWPRQEAARQLYPPDGAALISGPYLAGARENAPELRPPAYDPQESARLLDQAGLRLGPDGARRAGAHRFSLELLYPAQTRIYANIAEVLRGAYEKVGIELTQRPLDWAAYAQRLAAGEFDAAIGGNFYLPPNPDLYGYFHSSQTPPNGQNVGFYRNHEADLLMEAAQREMENGKRLELYRQVHRVLAGDPPADFLWSSAQYWGISKSVTGVATSPSFGLFHFLPGPLAWRPVSPKR